MNSAEKLSRIMHARAKLRRSVRMAAFPMVFGLPDLLLGVQRLPNIGHLYRFETALMILNGVTGLVAAVGILSRRNWGFWAFGIWLFAGTIRLLTVGNLR
jgi:hypothetical protein